MKNIAIYFNMLLGLNITQLEEIMPYCDGFTHLFNLINELQHFLINDPHNVSEISTLLNLIELTIEKYHLNNQTALDLFEYIEFHSELEEILVSNNIKLSE